MFLLGHVDGSVLKLQNNWLHEGVHVHLLAMLLDCSTDPLSCGGVPPFPSREWRQLGNGAAILSHARRAWTADVWAEAPNRAFFSDEKRGEGRREANVKFLTHFGERARSHLRSDTLPNGFTKEEAF